jgi:L-ribulose-5-phosphate 3-epimerase
MGNNYKLGLYEKALPNDISIIDKLNLCKKFNFDFMELSIDETDEKLVRLDLDNNEIESILVNSIKIGVRIESICLSALRKYALGSRDRVIREKGILITKKAIVLASKLGIRYIQLAGYDVYYEKSDTETKNNFITSLNKVVKFSSTYGVILAFETMENEFMDTVLKSLYYVNLINSPYLKIYPDIGNLTNASIKYETNPITDFKAGLGNIIAVHLKESNIGVYRDLIIGDGHVDFKSFIKESYEIGVSRFVCELWFKNYDNYKNNIELTYNKISEIIKGVYEDENNN